MIAEPRFETFPALERTGMVRHGFTQRVPGLEVKVERTLALARLDEMHTGARAAIGCGGWPLVFGEQIHGRELAIVDASTLAPVADVDGVLTAAEGVCLGVYVADCCAVFLVDPVRRAIGLLHSGRKGTELGITPAAIERMRAEFGSQPGDLIAQLSPCIRPPRYDVDFAATIVAQCHEAGVAQVFDCGTCTAAHPELYYSYRAERGKTGRMLALLALAPF